MRSPRVSLGPLALAAAGLAIGLAAPPSGLAGGEVLRWRLAPEQGIVFKVTGQDPRPLCDGAADERTLYGSEITADGLGLERPVGRPVDLAFHYLFRLP